VRELLPAEAWHAPTLRRPPSVTARVLPTPRVKCYDQRDGGPLQASFDRRLCDRRGRRHIKERVIFLTELRDDAAWD
jgi:hypothetical protein